MVSRTPAAELARLKVTFPHWSVRPVAPGKGVGFTAHRRAVGYRPQSFYAPTLAELEHELWLADSATSAADGLEDAG